MVEQIDPKRATPEQIARGLELLNKELVYKDKVKRGLVKGPKKWKDLTEAEKDKARLDAKKYNLKLKILRRKAAEAGITVSAAEVEAELKSEEAAKRR